MEEVCDPAFESFQIESIGQLIRTPANDLARVKVGENGSKPRQGVAVNKSSAKNDRNGGSPALRQGEIQSHTEKM